MPVKRRAAKRRVDELAAWRETFGSGYDDFDDLAGLGIEGSAAAGSPDGLKEMADRFAEAQRKGWRAIRAPSDETVAAHVAAYRAAREAWQRLGSEYMASRQPSDVRAVPWALDAFGEPPCR